MRNRHKPNYRWDFTEIYNMVKFVEEEPLDWCRLALIACRRRQRLTYSKVRETRLFYASAAVILENRLACCKPEVVDKARKNIAFYEACEFKKMTELG